jgi:hypothetical protein
VTDSIDYSLRVRLLTVLVIGAAVSSARASAILGPRTPDRGELSKVEPVHQSDVAAPLLELLGLDYREFDPEASPPIAAAFESFSGRRAAEAK